MVGKIDEVFEETGRYIFPEYKPGLHKTRTARLPKAACKGFLKNPKHKSMEIDYIKGF